MCLFTSARTVVIVFARSAGSEAMYCAGVLTFDGGFMDSSFSRTKCITGHLKISQRQGLGTHLKRTVKKKARGEPRAFSSNQPQSDSVSLFVLVFVLRVILLLMLRV